MRIHLLATAFISAALGLSFQSAQAVTFVSPTRTVKIMSYPQVKQVYIERCNDFEASDCFSAFVDSETLLIQYDKALQLLTTLLASPTEIQAMRIKMKSEIATTGRSVIELPMGGQVSATAEAMVETVFTTLLPQVLTKLQQMRPEVENMFDRGMQSYLEIQDERHEVSEIQLDQVFQKVKQHFLLN